MAKKKQMTAKQLKVAWVKALRSGKYEQTNGVLHASCENDQGRDQHAYCCLGVLCKVAVKRIPHGATSLDSPSLQDLRDSLNLGEIEEGHKQHKLTVFNDYKRWSFKRIASWIEKHV